MFQKGNKYGRGNSNSGRKTIKKEVAAVINGGLANQIANKRLVKLNEKDNVPLEEMKVVVMPVVIKGMTDKSESNVNVHLPIPIGNVLHDTSNKENLEANKAD
jgi:hypothetical protein